MSDERILDDISHRRFNLLTGSWILVSPHRTKRPWQGAQEEPAKSTLPAYDPSCFLCPNNRRATGDVMPDYKSTYIFINDYSAVKEDQPAYIPPPAESSSDLSPLLLQAEAVKGRCYVITFSPSHNLTLADLPSASLLSIIETWAALYTSHLPRAHKYFNTSKSAELGIVAPKEQYTYLQLFENKGSAMGCSNPHPHGQAWCTSSLPTEIAVELHNMREYKAKHGRGLLVDYVTLELEKRERIVFENNTWVALCPWWAIWPFELLVLPKREVASIAGLTDEERNDLAEMLSQCTKRYDNLFKTSFPYSMGLHQAPLNATEEEELCCHLHLHFYPPLLRSATVRKFLVGYELLAEPQRDITPEQAALRLKELDGEKTYREEAESEGN